MANTLARMERDGLVVRKKDTNDGRVQRIWLTDRARELQGPAISAAQEENAVRLAGFTKDEKRQFVALIQKVLRTRRPKEPGDT